MVKHTLELRREVAVAAVVEDDDDDSSPRRSLNVVPSRKNIVAVGGLDI